MGFHSACSSSLVAVHYAAKDIEDGRIDYAIAGGVNMILGNDFTDKMRSAGFLSKDQRCKTFDDSANGYVRAEGGGLVLLTTKTWQLNTMPVIRFSDQSKWRPLADYFCTTSGSARGADRRCLSGGRDSTAGHCICRMSWDRYQNRRSD